MGQKRICSLLSVALTSKADHCSPGLTIQLKTFVKTFGKFKECLMAGRGFILTNNPGLGTDAQIAQMTRRREEGKLRKMMMDAARWSSVERLD